MRKCSRCSVDKDISEFSKNSSRSDGLSNVCKPCAKIVAKEWRESNRFDGRIVASKRCSTCERMKDTSCFWKDKYVRDGFSNQCKDCIKLYRLKNREAILEDQRARNKKISESEKVEVTGRVCSQCNKYKNSDNFWKSKHTKDGLYTCCVECKKLLEATPERQLNRKKCSRSWMIQNRDKARKRSNDWDKAKRNVDVRYKLRRNTMHAIIASVRNYSFNTKLERLKEHIFDHLPYTSDELKAHIESLWESWMNWDNYGRFDKERMTWQIDHIVPQSKLPFESFEDKNFQKLWALENLRPLETITNIKKGNKPVSLDEAQKRASGV